MNPRLIEPTDLAYWDHLAPIVTMWGSSDPDVEPCPSIVTDCESGGSRVTRVPWVLDEIELMHLAKGGTLWLSIWGALPPHMLEVTEAPA